MVDDRAGRVVIIGGGHNGLAAAFSLARAGLRPLVLEARDTIGGGAITGEICPGFSCPTLGDDVSSFDRAVAGEMSVERHGVQFLSPGVRVFAPGLDGRALTIFEDGRRTTDSIRSLSAHDADAYPGFADALARTSSVLGSLLAAPPPDIDHPSADDLWHLLKTGRQFRKLGKRDSFRLLRWAPMPAADLAQEWFEHDLLRATVAAPGASGNRLGPRSAGSALLLLMREAHRQRGGPARIVGGPGALTRAMAAAAVAAGVEIRVQAPVRQITVKDERVQGVVAGDGNEVHTSTVISAVDPKTTFLRLVDPAALSPDFINRIGNYRSTGTLAKLNLALSALPAFTAAQGTNPAETLAGRVHLGPDLDYLERAFDHTKYGESSAHPWLDITIPSLLDPTLAPSGAHVMSICVHYAPHVLREGPWSEEARDRLFKATLATLNIYAPGIDSLIVGRQMLTPADIEREFGCSGGHVFHGELAVDQLFAMRPLLGYGNYRAPIQGLYLCSAGTHPGGFMTGTSGVFAARQVLRDLRT